MRQLYHVLGRTISPLFILFLRLFTLLTGTERTRVLVINEKNEVLLVKGVISDGRWSLPGGGIARGEKPVAAARRELHEETGISVPEKEFRYLKTIEKTDAKVSYRSPLYLLHTKRSALPAKPVNPWEISHIGWFQMNHLPTPLAPITEVALRTYKEDF